MAQGKRRAGRPKASSWDKLAARTSAETLDNRDVFDDQQLDRSVKQTKRSNTLGTVLALTVGAAVAILIWVLCSMVAVMVASLGGMASGMTGGGAEPGSYYYVEDSKMVDGSPVDCFNPVDRDGDLILDAECYDQAEDVPVPDWYEPAESADDATPSQGPTLGSELGTISGVKLFFSLAGGGLIAIIIGSWTSRQVKKHNVRVDHSDINEHRNDQHLSLPEEVMRKFDWAPDSGAHFSSQVSTMISHVMLKKKGLGTVEVAQRAEEDELDEDGAVAYYKGEAKVDDEGRTITKTRPMIDEEFGTALFEASGLTEKALQKTFDATTIPYNPGGRDRDKLGHDPKLPKGKKGQYEVVADLIKDDWEFPDYEVQRPGGAYLVDTSPTNTMVLAITRAGKGQTYIEPIIDMWSREKNPSNMVVNDPKGELLVNNYVPFVMRGFEPVQFNLINPMKTNIYNPLGMAAEAAREGNSTKTAMYVENIADVFFPTDGSEDPVWPNAANNAFKRAAYGLIDYYLEEEREMREHAAATKLDPATLEQQLDDMWGKVTLYNCYQLFVQLTSKKIKNPKAELEQRVKNKEFEDDEDAFRAAEAEVEKKAFLWEDKGEQDMLTLFFNATEALPTNTMRQLIGNANNALRAMAGAEKMLASVYGIAITAMSFFTDPTISALTSGKPSQNTDLAGLSFPRRMGVRFAPDYIKRDHLKGLQVVWSAYADPQFSEDLGKDFGHEDIVSMEGWARYNFKGIFPKDEAWLKLELKNPQSGMLVRTFYFHFKKGYQLSLNGRHFVVEPVTGRKIVKNGVLRELKPVRAGGTRDGAIESFKPGDTMYPHSRLDFASGGNPELIEGETRAITQSMVRYSEQPKAVFLVTPPHLMKYAKLILILVKQLFDVSADQAYMTKANQKPLYRTRFMLDELGNLQSEGHGIDGFETMLSIGLGQEQQFTLILQTLQQLRNVYGETSDKVIQGNVGNIVFLKSTDDAMIETLEKMSGTRHVSRTGSKQITENLDKIAGGRTDGSIARTTQTEEEPLIKYNDMAFLSPRNSIVFRAGDAPVWNRNETILPMSFKLLRSGSKMIHPGHEYTLQTIPTLSSAIDFDVRRNQPDFRAMLDKRMAQAERAKDAKEMYRELHDYKEVDIERLDPDVYADEVMEVVTVMTAIDAGHDPNAPVMVDPEEYEAMAGFSDEDFIANTEVAAEIADREASDAERRVLRYAEGRVSQEMLVNKDGSAKLRSLDFEIGEAYRSARTAIEADHAHFRVGGDGELRSADGSKTYISETHSDEYADAARRLNGEAERKDSRVFAEGDLSAEDLQVLSSVKVHAAFYQYLASLPSWGVLADGEFDRAMAVEMKSKE